ncbi:MAG: hypothetical protein ABJA02_13010 [Acidobacteriota bacterium]
MRLTLIRFIFISLIAAFACGSAAAQAADNGSLFGKPDDKDSPSGVRDMLKRMEIEKDKKEFAELQDRGKEAAELSDELQRSIDVHHGELTSEDRVKLDTLEKMVKRIRRDLGGSDDDTVDKDDVDAEKKPASVNEGFASLRSETVKLNEELQKTSRFTVSTSAIRLSNVVLRLTRSLKFWK